MKLCVKISLIFVLFAFFGQAQDTSLILKKIEAVKTIVVTDQVNARIQADWIIEKSISANFLPGQWEGYIAKGTIDNYSGNFSSALANYDKALSLIPSVQNTLIGRVIYNKGTVYNGLGNYSLAAKKYFEALHYLEPNVTKEDRHWSFAAYQALGRVFGNLEQHKKAKEYFLKSLEKAEEINLEVPMGYSNIFLGQNHTKLGEYDKAQEYFETARYYAEETQDIRLEFYLNYYLAEFYFETNNLDKAYKHAVKAENCTSPTQFASRLSETKVLQGKVHFMKKSYSIAENYFLQADSISRKMKTKAPELEAIYYLAQIYTIQKEYEKSAILFLRYAKLNDTLTGERNFNLISSVTDQYENENRINKRKLKEKKRENLLLLEQKRDTIIIVSILAVVLALIILLYISRQQQKLKSKEIEKLRSRNQVVTLEAVLKGEEMERKRLSEDLHDGLNADLSVLTYQLSAIDDKDLSPETDKTIKSIISSMDRAISELREVSHNLAPPALLNYNLVESIQSYCNKISANSDLEVDFQCFGRLVNLRLTEKTAIYRIVQELTTNVLKHANADSLIIHMNYHKNNINLTVEDNGDGFNIDSYYEGIGLKNIESRIKYLQADHFIESSSEGTCFVMEIDLIKLAEARVE